MNIIGFCKNIWRKWLTYVIRFKIWLRSIFYQKPIINKGISSDTLKFLLHMGKESHPREFAALLVPENEVISVIYPIPGTIGGSDSASVILDMVPLNLGHIGSAHSHPSGAIRPSEADISFFSRTGSCHIIVGYPYEQDCWRCFRSDGSPIDLPVIADD